jgi:hypothetical protein
MFQVHIFHCICVTIKMSLFQKSINYESTIVVIMTTSLAIGLGWHSSYIHLQVSWLNGVTICRVVIKSMCTCNVKSKATKTLLLKFVQINAKSSNDWCLCNQQENCTFMCNGKCSLLLICLVLKIHLIDGVVKLHGIIVYGQQLKFLELCHCI